MHFLLKNKAFFIIRYKMAEEHYRHPLPLGEIISHFKEHLINLDGILQYWVNTKRHLHELHELKTQQHDEVMLEHRNRILGRCAPLFTTPNLRRLKSKLNDLKNELSSIESEIKICDLHIEYLTTSLRRGGDLIIETKTEELSRDKKKKNQITFF